MNSDWIDSDTTLEGEMVTLVPLTEVHFDVLDELAKEMKIWEFIPADMSSSEKRLAVFKAAVTFRKEQTQYPFVIIYKPDNKVIGCTRLMEVFPKHKKLEIGWTWLHPDYWATSVNAECKLLLLTFCFEQLKTIRVQLKTDENNLRSRRAIEKIGAKYEGILRRDWIRENGRIRNSVYFSIIDTEWPEAKQQLVKKVKHKLDEWSNK